MALLEVLDGVFTAADEKQVTVLIGLDLSAAFDTVDHRLLLDRLRLEFGVTATVLDWLQSYLKGRSQFVKIGQHQTPTIGVDVGVPQGSACAWPSVVRGLLQPGGRSHRSPRRTVSPLRQRHAASSRHARRQHNRRAVCSRRVYH